MDWRELFVIGVEVAGSRWTFGMWFDLFIGWEWGGEVGDGCVPT